MDVVAFHLVTVGRRATEYAQELFKADNYADYLYFHGLSVEGAEALANLDPGDTHEIALGQTAHVGELGVVCPFGLDPQLGEELDHAGSSAAIRRKASSTL